MLAGVVVMIISLFFVVSAPTTTHILLLVGMFLVLASSVIGLLIATKVLTSKINKRSPRYRSAKIHAIVMAIIFVVALAGVIFAFIQVM